MVKFQADNILTTFHIGLVFNGEKKNDGTLAIYSLCSSPTDKSRVYKDSSLISDYGYSLDTRLLKVRTVLGVKLRRNGDVRFFSKAEDEGVAFKNVPRNVYAFVDVIDYVTKISIV